MKSSYTASQCINYDIKAVSFNHSFLKKKKITEIEYIS